MNLLQTLKSAVVRLNSRRDPLFAVSVTRQKAFLESLPEPKDLLERAYAQYRCQMMLERPILRAGYQLAAMLLLPVYRRQLLRRPAPRKEQAADAVFAYDSEDTILPESLRGEFAHICQVRDFQNALFLTGEDCSFLRELARRYPTAFYFRFKCMAKLAMYRSLYETYRPKAIIVSEEYSYTSSFLTEYCHRLGMEHINVMHGEKLYYIRDSFFHFDRCYVWDECYRRLFCDLRTELMQFRVELPPSMQPREKPSMPPEVDLTYYLQEEVVPGVILALHKRSRHCRHAAWSSRSARIRAICRRRRCSILKIFCLKTVPSASNSRSCVRDAPYPSTPPCCCKPRSMV